MTINLWICVPVQMDFLTTKILVKTTYRWFCEDNVLVAFVYVRHQPQKERKAELESRFRGEGGSGGWSWSKQSTSWPPVLDLYFLYFCISSPVLDLFFFLLLYFFSCVGFVFFVLLCFFSCVGFVFVCTYAFTLPRVASEYNQLCSAHCLYSYCRLITIWSWFVSFLCFIVSLKISQRNLFVWQLYNIGKRFLKDVSQKFFHTQLYWSVQESLSKVNFILSRLRQIEVWVNQIFILISSDLIIWQASLMDMNMSWQ